MPARVNKVHPALKHAGYSASTILPGESAAEFEKLHRDLIAEFSPNGRYEEHLIASMAQVAWRLQNLEIFRIVQRARARLQQLINEKAPPDPFFPSFAPEDPAVRAAYQAAYKEATRAAEQQTRKEFDDVYELVEMGEDANIEALERELEVKERLEAMLEKCLKRLLFARGVKSISVAPASSAPRRVAGPRRPHREDVS
jgi:hypothetical protein